MDNVSKAKRSQIMRAIKSSGTRPEMEMAKMLGRMQPALGWVDMHDKELPGRPDFSIKTRSMAIFVHGCFFHGCPKHYKRPNSNVDFWVSKVQANMRRDVRAVRRLNRMGWSVVRVWEHSLKKNYVERTEKRLLKRIQANHSRAGFTGLRARRRCTEFAGNNG